MIAPSFVLTLLFAYGPLAGLYMAFVEFVPKIGNFWPTLFHSKFVGFDWFMYFFSGQDFIRVMRNTLASSVLTLTIGFFVPIFIAILLNECKSITFKKIVQTSSYLPYFVSWVIASNIIVTLLSANGVLNQILMATGITNDSIVFLQEGKYFWIIIALSNTWKDMGYNTIIYLAAISAINLELFESASVDGAGRLRQIWHILLPSIKPTMVILLILNVGNLLNTGFDQYFLLGNSTTREFSDVIDTYSFRYGIQNNMYSYATAVGLFKSVVAFILVVTVNKIAKKFESSHLF
ncbi:MAG: sugar transporter permease [Clostridiales bacterium]|jgi:putative aldouronate transport system permease protein|nr:sugar transporter permease [Clostridiales bacterium]